MPSGASEVQNKTLGQVKDRQVRVYAVWVPILGTDVEASVAEATLRLPDERVSHFWDGDGELVKEYSRIMGLGDRPAWDVFLLFGSKAEWKAAPPAPDYWMHQLRLAPERQLDGNKLAKEIEKLLGNRARVRKRGSDGLDSVLIKAFPHICPYICRAGCLGVPAPPAMNVLADFWQTTLAVYSI
jgi:hypothetical protein